VLVEFPGWWLDVDGAVALVADAARGIEGAGLVPLLAHPERCAAVAEDPCSVRPLAEAGWPLCLNGPSLTGDHAPLPGGRHGSCSTTASCRSWRRMRTGSRDRRVSTAYAAVEAASGRDATLPLFDGSAIPDALISRRGRGESRRAGAGVVAEPRCGAGRRRRPRSSARACPSRAASRCRDALRAEEGTSTPEL
jgi:hypothetical protein